MGVSMYGGMHGMPLQQHLPHCRRLPPPDLSAAPELLGLDCEMCATSVGDKVLLAAAVVDQQKRTLVRVSDRGTLLQHPPILHHPSMCDVVTNQAPLDTRVHMQHQQPSTDVTRACQPLSPAHPP
jgi:hypothetical protein